MPKGGKQPGAGRPVGTLNPDTIRKQAIRKRILDRFEAELDSLVGAQMDNARGLKHFFLRDPVTKQFKQITDPKQIEVALNCGEEGSYYWIHTKDPSTQAFTAVADRAIDRPTEHHEHSGEDGGPVEHVFRWGR